jgi:hypothetical protein
MDINGLSRRKLAVLLNVAAVIGVAIGMAAGNTKQLEYGVRAGVFIIAFVNFMFFIVRPRIIAARATGISVSWFQLSLDAVREQPFMAALTILLLTGASRSAAAAVTFATSSGSAYVRSLPNSSTIAVRMIVMAIVMTGIALCWFVDAVGLWAQRTWAWWLALVLNGLAAAVTIALQILNLHMYLLDVLAVIAVVLLFTPPVRTVCRQPISE